MSNIPQGFYAYMYAEDGNFKVVVPEYPSANAFAENTTMVAQDAAKKLTLGLLNDLATGVPLPNPELDFDTFKATYPIDGGYVVILIKLTDLQPIRD